MDNYLFLSLQPCGYYDDCACFFTSEPLGCLNRTDIVCPEIDSYDLGIVCHLYFCLCHDVEPETCHCLFPSDCPTTTTMTTTPATPSRTSVATTASPPPTPEEACPDV